MPGAETQGPLVGRSGLRQCPQLVVQCGRLEQAVEATRVQLQGPSEGLRRGKGEASKERVHRRGVSEGEIRSGCISREKDPKPDCTETGEW